MARDDGESTDAKTPDADGVETLVDPEPERATRFVRTATTRGDYVTVVGDCTVEYDGRASSTLGSGRRHVLHKPDGTVLVHEADGHQPVNWQPAGGDVAVHHEASETDAAIVVLRATSETPEEELVVRFSAISQASAFEMGESSSPETVGTEADLKEYVLAEPESIERGLQPLATERETPAGPVDVYAEDDSGRPVVVELKRARVGPDAVGQLSRYVDALARDLHAGADPRGILVAPSVTDRARKLLAEAGLEYARVEPPGED